MMLLKGEGPCSELPGHVHSFPAFVLFSKVPLGVAILSSGGIAGSAFIDIGAVQLKSRISTWGLGPKGTKLIGQR